MLDCLLGAKGLAAVMLASLPQEHDVAGGEVICH